MITLGEIMLAMKSLPVKADNYFTGKLDSKLDKSIGIYQLQGYNSNSVAIGGREVTKTKEKAISILIHYNRNSVQTEQFAYDLYLSLEKLQGVSVRDYTIKYVKLLNNEPVDVGTDNNNVYERVIECIIYYE